MGVSMAMNFTIEENQPREHENRGTPIGGLHPLAEKEYGKKCAHKRPDRKIGAGPRSANFAEGLHEQYQTQPVADGTDQEGYPDAGKGRPSSRKG